jgi:hypothetical protein
VNRISSFCLSTLRHSRAGGNLPTSKARHRETPAYAGVTVEGDRGVVGVGVPVLNFVIPAQAGISLVLS